MKGNGMEGKRSVRACKEGALCRKRASDSQRHEQMVFGHGSVVFN